MKPLATERLPGGLFRFALRVALALAAACQRSTGPAAGRKAGSAESVAPLERPDLRHKLTDYHLRGVVRQVETELSHVRIDHEAIPEFMAAMEMRFPYKDRDFLEELKPGDLVEGTLRVESENGAVIEYELMGLESQEARSSAHIGARAAAKGELRPAERPKQLEPGPRFPTSP